MATATKLLEPPAYHGGTANARGRLDLLAALLVVSVATTAFHYPHNYIEVRHYPQSSFLPIGYEGTRLAIAVGWPLLTAIGAFGLWLYRRGSYPAAWACLAVYSLTGISSLAHFIDGSPHISAFWYATMFTDALAGMAILAFVYVGVVHGRVRLGAQ